MDDALESGLFPAILAICLFTIAYPWRFRSRLARWLVHLPLLLVPMFIVYERTIPTGMNIRADLLVLGPAMGIGLLLYVMKLVLLCRRTKDDAA